MKVKEINQVLVNPSLSKLDKMKQIWQFAQEYFNEKQCINNNSCTYQPFNGLEGCFVGVFIQDKNLAQLMDEEELENQAPIFNTLSQEWHPLVPENLKLIPQEFWRIGQQWHDISPEYRKDSAAQSQIESFLESFCARDYI